MSNKNFGLTATMPIVVGVDATAASLHAVAWAAREAARRNCGLRLLHACAYASPEHLPPHQHLLKTKRGSLRNAYLILGKALKTAKAVAFAVHIEEIVKFGDPTQVLVAESVGASLIVLGSHGTSGASGLLLKSVSLSVAARSTCPVIIARGAFRDDGPIVVGYDTHENSDAAVEFAANYAEQVRAPLVVMHIWTSGIVEPEREIEDEQFQENRSLAQNIALWQEKLPSVDMHMLAVDSHNVAKALSESATGPQMIVIGSRGRGPILGGIIGSTGNALAGRAPCPVAIVRT